MLNAWRATCIPALDTTASEPANALPTLLPVLDIPAAQLNASSMEQYGRHRNALEFSGTDQTQTSLQPSYCSNDTDWESMPQQMASDFTLEAEPDFNMWPTNQSTNENVEKLTRLALDLHQNGAALSRVVVGYGQPKSAHPEGPLKGHTQKFAVDDTFRFTQTLMDIVQVLYKTAPVEVSDDRRSIAGLPLDNGDATTISHPGHVVVVERRSNMPVRRCIDQPTFHLVMSCWLQLGSIYYTIFKHIKTCVDERTIETVQDGQPVVLPGVEVGNFQVPFTTAITLQMFTSIMMGSQILQCMMGLVEDIEAGQSWEQNRTSTRTGKEHASLSEPTVVEVVCKDVRYRANILFQKLHFTRSLLLCSGLV